MICPSCAGEFRPGIGYCPECNVPLIEAKESREPTSLEPILCSALPEEVAAFTARLRAAGMPYVEQSGTALALFEGGRLFGGQRADEWEGRVWVLSSQMEEARGLLVAAAEVSAPLDEWPEADEGESLADYEDRVNRRSD